MNNRWYKPVDGPMLFWGDKKTREMVELWIVDEMIHDHCKPIDEGR